MEAELGVIWPAASLTSPSSCVSFETGFCSPLEISPGGGGGEVFEVEKERLLGALHEIADRYDDCFLRLRAATAELAGLRREHLHLAAENLHLSLLVDELEPSAAARPASKKQGLEPDPTTPAWSRAAGGTRGSIPKSISIRSKGFLSPPPPPAARGGGGGGPAAPPQRLRVRASPTMEGGGKEEGKEVEVEVYRQGMEKTELCNKWEEGVCPYGGKCRFAHGVQELRPIIRHPLYKTLPCRMFAASCCPYGHRCHFRHSPLPTAAKSS